MINDEPHNLVELPYFDQSAKVFRTGSIQVDTLIKHNLIGKNWPAWFSYIVRIPDEIAFHLQSGILAE